MQFQPSTLVGPMITLINPLDFQITNSEAIHFNMTITDDSFNPNQTFIPKAGIYLVAKGNNYRRYNMRRPFA